LSFPLRRKLAKLFRPAPPPLRIQFYTRANCLLCEDAKALLAPLAKRYSLEIEMRDVDADLAWAEQYGERLPVLVIAGRERFWGRINPQLLERFIRHELQR
jgi:glutaredoxin